jgi:hypothetical protein
MNKNIKIAINAQLLPGKSGGVESALLGLLSALGKLEEGAEEYFIIGNRKEPNWLKP